MRIWAKGRSWTEPRNWGRKATKNSATLGLVRFTRKPRRNTSGTVCASAGAAPALRQVVMARKSR